MATIINSETKIIFRYSCKILKYYIMILKYIKLWILWYKVEYIEITKSKFSFPFYDIIPEPLQTDF
jgi:hypothetical protein